jgi:hypothetical protein
LVATKREEGRKKKTGEKQHSQREKCEENDWNETPHAIYPFECPRSLKWRGRRRCDYH